MGTTTRLKEKRKKVVSVAKVPPKVPGGAVAGSASKVHKGAVKRANDVSSLGNQTEKARGAEECLVVKQAETRSVSRSVYSHVLRRAHKSFFMIPIMTVCGPKQKNSGQQTHEAVVHTSPTCLFTRWEKYNCCIMQIFVNKLKLYRR